jgi:hypothetical protein
LSIGHHTQLEATMNVAQREWISLKEASKQVGIPMTTIRDCTSGAD